MIVYRVLQVDGLHLFLMLLCQTIVERSYGFIHLFFDLLTGTCLTGTYLIGLIPI